MASARCLIIAASSQTRFMTRIRKSITLHPRIVQMAEEIMPVQGFGDLTALIESLIREKHTSMVDQLTQTPPPCRLPITEEENREMIRQSRAQKQ